LKPARPRIELQGKLVKLRSVGEDDLPRLLEIIHAPAVAARWASEHHDLQQMRKEFVDDDEVEAFVIELDGEAVGSIQYSEEPEPNYRHASIDIFVHPDFHGRGICTDALSALVAYLIDERGHHRLTIDPAADNLPAIACYKKVGFKPVGILRKYERGRDGTWHDGLLMDLLAEEFR
jgi:aminoglycoside 6'-N-acetyltransferase